MWYTRVMRSMKLASDYAVKHTDKADFLHSSGYAKVQNGDNFGAAGTASFEARKALNEQRKYVRQYSSSKIGNGRYSGLKPQVYRPEKDSIGLKDAKDSIVSRDSKDTTNTGSIRKYGRTEKDNQANGRPLQNNSPLKH